MQYCPMGNYHIIFAMYQNYPLALKNRCSGDITYFIMLVHHEFSYSLNSNAYVKFDMTCNGLEHTTL